jgi:tRNA-specific 2-thiouridylase
MAFHSINGQLPPTDITLKIRHTPEFIPATLEPAANSQLPTANSQLPTANSYMVHAAQPIHGVAPGQFCVVYDADHHRCYGSGEITV